MVGSERRVSAIADSAGMANVLYGVHDRFEALFDSKTFCSNGVFKHIEEGSRRRETKVTYDYPKRKSVLHETNLKTNETKYAENDIPPCVTDVVTGFYQLLVSGSVCRPRLEPIEPVLAEALQTRIRPVHSRPGHDTLEIVREEWANEFAQP